jgi:hypothetical protein
MEILTEINTLLSMAVTLWRERDIGTILLFLAGVVAYYRGHVKSEKLITHTNDTRATEETNALRAKMDMMLRVIESSLYSGVESFVYDSHGGHSRRISIVRKSKPVDIPACDYLVEYHDALHKCVLEHAPAIIINELIVHRVFDSPINEEQENISARNLRDLICFDIHGYSGTNRQIREIENRILPYSEIVEMYREICVVARNLRAIKSSAIEQDILEHRIPLVPNVGNMIKSSFKPRKNRKKQ